MNHVTTSEEVLCLAKSKRTDPKLKKVAKAWKLDYIQIYREWYPLGCSRDFLIPLVELSRLIGEYAQGRQILLDSKQERIGISEPTAKDWAITDVKTAVSKAKKLVSTRDIPRSTRNEGTTQSSHAREPVGTRARGTRKRTRHEEDLLDTGRTSMSGADDTSVHWTSESSEHATNTPAQRHSDAAAQHEWSNDDRVNILLRTFNPDPSFWYITPTQILETGGGVCTTGVAFEDAGTPPKMVLMPLRGADEAHQVLVVFDRMRAHAFIFGAESCDHAAELAWSTAQTLLRKTAILQGEASMDLYPFPSMLPNEGVSRGILLIVAALHKLHERPMESVSPKLWRALLAGFFPDARDLPQARIDRLLADLKRLTFSEENEGVGIEQDIKDAKSLRVAQTTVESYAGQAKLLLQMTEGQLQSKEKRRKLIELHKWLLAKPPDTDEFISEIAALETHVVSQIKTLPDISEWCERQLDSVKTSCQYAVKACEQTTLTLESRRKAIIEAADAKHKQLGVKLISLST